MLTSAKLCSLSQVSVRAVNIELMAEIYSAIMGTLVLLECACRPRMLITEKVDNVLPICFLWVGDRDLVEKQASSHCAVVLH